MTLEFHEWVSVTIRNVISFIQLHKNSSCTVHEKDRNTRCLLECSRNTECGCTSIYCTVMQSLMHPDWGNKLRKSWFPILKFIFFVVQYNVRLVCQSYRFHVIAIFSKMHWMYTVHECCVHTKTRRGEFSNEKWRVKVYDDPNNLSFNPLIKLYTVENIPLALGFKFMEEFINVVVQVFSTRQLQEKEWG